MKKKVDIPLPDRIAAVVFFTPALLVGAVQKAVAPPGEYVDLYEGSKNVLKVAITGYEDVED